MLRMRKKQTSGPMHYHRIGSQSYPPKLNRAASDAGTILLLWKLHRCQYSMQTVLCLDSGGETFRIQLFNPFNR
jgi:hypothetical protein